MIQISQQLINDIAMPDILYLKDQLISVKIFSND